MTQRLNLVVFFYFFSFVSLRHEKYSLIFIFYDIKIIIYGLSTINIISLDLWNLQRWYRSTIDIDTISDREHIHITCILLSCSIIYVISSDSLTWPPSTSSLWTFKTFGDNTDWLLTLTMSVAWSTYTLLVSCWAVLQSILFLDSLTR